MQETWVWSKLGKPSGEDNGNPLQYSSLENSKDRGNWWATIHWSQGVRHNWTINIFTFHFLHLHYILVFALFFLDFFLMWTIFKIFIEFVTILPLFYILVSWLQGMWVPSTPALTACIRRQSFMHYGVFLLIVLSLWHNLKWTTEQL